MLVTPQKFAFAAFYRTFVTLQFAIVTGLLLLSLAAYMFVSVTGYARALGLVRLLDLNEEQNLPTFLSTLNLLLASFLLFVIWRLTPAWERPSRRYWLALALIFVYLSFDENAGIHETVLTYVGRASVGNVHEMLGGRDWIPIGLALTLVAGLVLVNFLRHLPPWLTVQFIIAGALFVAGVFGFELAGAWFLYSGGTEFDMLFRLDAVAKEGCEMYGIALFNCALFRVLAARSVYLEIAAYT